MPDAVAQQASPDTVALPQVAPVAAAVAPEPEPTPEPEPAASVPISPYSAPEPAASDPTPTEAFAMALGGAPERKRRHWVAWLVVLVLLVVAYVTAAVLLRDTVPTGTTIEGISAGETVTTATAAARAVEAAASATPLTLTAGDNSTRVDAASAGLSIDVDATVANVGGFTLNPVTLWNRLTGQGTDHYVVVKVDDTALAAAADAAADELDSTLSEASVTIDGTHAVATPSSQAVAVDRAAATDQILAAWPTTQPIELPAEVGDPEVTTREATAVAAGLNGHVFAGPITLTGPNGDVVLPAEQIAANSQVVAADGTLTWQVDGNAISAIILTAHPGVENEPVDASYRFTKAHKLEVTEGEPGRALDSPSVGAAVVAAGRSLARSAPIPYVETPPKVTADQLPTQDFTARVSHFRTPLTPEPIRTKNLVRAAQLITGTIIKPGERFNLTDTIGPITKANGYFDAHVIVNGVLTTGIGGGLSQVATTSFNAGYFAGYEDITHRPHSVWFPRYPPGRESTVVNGSINVVFENTTPYAAIMSSYVAGGYLYVDIWSTPYFTVKTSASEKTNVVQPHVVDSTAKDCEAKPNGQAGFRITNTRWVYLGDELQEKKSFTWTYRPDNGIRCVDTR